MTGTVSDQYRPMVEVAIYPAADASKALSLAAWIDTGFESDILVPEQWLIDHAFRHSSNLNVTLADGKPIEMPTYRGWITWFGVRRFVSIFASQGDEAVLLGTGLLLNRRVLIDFPKRVVTIT
jgi:predicted aspartyl protease